MDSNMNHTGQRLLLDSPSDTADTHPAQPSKLSRMESTTDNTLGAEMTYPYQKPFKCPWQASKLSFEALLRIGQQHARDAYKKGARDAAYPFSHQAARLLVGLPREPQPDSVVKRG